MTTSFFPELRKEGGFYRSIRYRRIAMTRCRSIFLVGLLLLGCSNSERKSANGQVELVDGMGGSSVAQLVCASDSECDDALFCNGQEYCDLDSARADARGCVVAEMPCITGGQRCIEEEQVCETLCAVTEDADGDGLKALECGGSDCDDSDANRFPGNQEVCDSENVDEDCDSSTFGLRDQDADGETDWACCNFSSDGLSCGTDCDDLNSGANSRVPEVCDGLDNNCDGNIDEGVSRAVYVDADGDGYGDPTLPMTVDCSELNGVANNGLDCNDSDPAFRPGAVELCDGLDNNCDGVYERDIDNDGHLEPEALCLGEILPKDDCNDLDGSIYAGAQEICDGLDNDCDLEIDERDQADLGCSAAEAVAASYCLQRSCELARCEIGWGDCNQNQADGCEASLRDDVSHCGACNVACPSGAACVDGVCDKPYLIDLSLGERHACALSRAGGLVCWGENASGELGNGTLKNARRWSSVLDLDGVVDFSASQNASCAADQDGEVWCWGSGEYNQLGTEVSVTRSRPIKIGLGGVQTLDGSGRGFCAQKGGDAYCWGWILGLEGRTEVPGRIPYGESIVSVAANTGRHCAVTSSGSVECAGIRRLGRENSYLPDACSFSLPNNGGQGAYSCLSTPQSNFVSESALEISGSCIHDGSEVICWDNIDDSPEVKFDASYSTERILAVRDHDSADAVAEDAGTCVLYEGGEAYCDARFLPISRSPTPISPEEVTAVDIGPGVVCAIIAGEVECAGSGPIAGVSDMATRPTFDTVGSEVKLVELLSGAREHCVRTSFGELLCWGDQFPEVTEREELAGALKTAKAANFHCLLMADATIRCEGNNDEGQLGGGSGEELRTLSLAAAKDIAVAEASACAILSDGDVWCWGRAESSSFGAAVADGSSILPTRVEGLEKIVQVSISENFGCALDQLGGVWCWGNGEWGQLGNSSLQTSPMPTKVRDLPDDIFEIGVGERHACAVAQGGDVYCWGDSEFDQLGLNQVPNSSLPRRVPGLEKIKELSVGPRHNCAIDEQSSLWCWGENLYGQLGIGVMPSSLSESALPTKVEGLAFSKVDTSVGTTCALSLSQEAYCWGRQIEGQLFSSAACDVVDFTEGPLQYFERVCSLPVRVEFL
ncbi:MAG: hypothetical protein MK135_10680 [Polyangiaceae bacterium]|nr:hypothetical protein [Polyangiaceae bacterium]